MFADAVVAVEIVEADPDLLPPFVGSVVALSVGSIEQADLA